MYALLVAAAAAAPLAPQGSWTVAYERSMCLASRKFGANGEVELLLRPSPLGDALEITFVERASGERRVVLNGGGHIQAGPGGVRRDAPYQAWRSPSQKGRVTVINTSQRLLGEVSDGGWLRFDDGHAKAVAVEIQQFAKLRPVLADCKRKVAQHWGVDTAALDRLDKPAEPIGDPARWVSPYDYPPEALSKGQSGQVTLLFRVNPEGRIDECRVIETTGVSALETVSCRAMTQRARFQPARDRDGQAMVSWEIRRVRWITAG